MSIKTVMAMALAKPVRWSMLYVPAFCVAVLIALKAAGGLGDMIDYVLEVGARSVPLLVAIALTHSITHSLGWNLDNTYRNTLQKILAGSTRGSRWGAFAVLAGELAAILLTLTILLLALLAWQG